MQIETLIEDIESLVLNGVKEELYDSEEIGRRMADVFSRRLHTSDEKRVPKVWFSNVGSKCVRQLWYKLHCDGEGRPLSASDLIKFTYGDLLEEMCLELAVVAGHSVSHQQARLSIASGAGEITGRIDGIIDGVLVDVKSASGYSFGKFERHLEHRDDSFGYLGQLGGYLLAAKEAGLPCESNRAAFFVINKENGKMCLDFHEFSDLELRLLSEKLEYVKRKAEGDEVPDRAFDPEPDGASGNKKLGVNCSYCQFNKKCWPGLRMFLYSNKPRFLTNVAKLPNVPEVTNFV